MKQSATAASRPAASWIVFAAAMGFLGGMMVMAALVTMFPSGAAAVAEPLIQAAPRKVEVKPTKKEEPAPVAPPPPAAAVAAAGRPPAIRSTTCGIAQLTLPVQGIKRDDLRDTFNEMRGIIAASRGARRAGAAQHAGARGRGRHGRASCS